MYIPRSDRVTDRGVLLEAMRSYSFGILIGPGVSDCTAPVATHLPLVVRDEGEHGVVLGHFAKANPHWSALAGRETLVIFPGPHGYVSPSVYTESPAVPTWNYIAVHAHGTLEPIEDDEGKLAVLEDLIGLHEASYLAKWNAMPEGYRSRMLAGITAFHIPIARIEGKFKISANRSAADRENVRAAHATGNPNERELARWMERLIP